MALTNISKANIVLYAVYSVHTQNQFLSCDSTIYIPFPSMLLLVLLFCFIFTADPFLYAGSLLHGTHGTVESCKKYRQ